MPMKTLVLIVLALIALAFGAVALDAQVKPTTPADIAGDAAVHSITTDTARARLVTIKALSTNSTATCGTSSIAGCVRFGDANISTSRGGYLLPGESYTFPIVGSASGTINWALAGIYYLVQSGDKISIIYVQ